MPLSRHVSLSLLAPAAAVLAAVAAPALGQRPAPPPAHWAYRPPVRPVPPEVGAGWARGAIDRFVLARLRAAGLGPSPEADRYTLIRRLSLDTRGLPPSEEEIEAFVGDPRPDAYERLVDRLLEDPAYGEHRARYWLDQARYADTAGYADDPPRTIWAYRDWVIRAFERHLPFDRFTMLQLAGDLMAGVEDEDLVATAFHRNTMTNNEGGTDDEEFRVAAVVDRTDTTMTVWMATTIRCARCHDHKYDPFTQEDYFRLYAFFDNTEDSDKKDERPLLRLWTKEQKAERARLRRRLQQARRALSAESPALRAGRREWSEGLAPRIPWRPLARVGPGRFATDLPAVTALRLRGTAPRGEVTARVAATTGRRPGARFVRVVLPGRGRVLSLAEVQVFSGARNVALGGKASQASTAFNGPADLAIDGNRNGHFFDARSTTHTARGRDPWWEVDLGREWAIDRIVIWNRTDSEEARRRLAGFAVQLLGEAREVVWRAKVREAPDPSVALEPEGARVAGVAAQWRARGGAGRVLLLERPLVLHGATLEVEGLAEDVELAATNDAGLLRYRGTESGVLARLATPEDARTARDREALARHYRSIAPELAPLRARIAALEQRLEKMQPRTTVPILRELPQGRRRTTRIHRRGNHRDATRAVTPGVPAVFPPLPAGARADRLALARWLVSRENPLTARVLVNRLWEQIFGIGLVETSEDFGTRGAKPSHPLLLDWLATELVRGGWRIEHVLRLIFTSATYRQSSTVTPERLARDPRNRLLSRGPRLRLGAEAIRDTTLALAGLLSAKRYGPPVRPPRPRLGLRAAFGRSTDWEPSRGEDRYRRGIYTFWQRSIPYPSMAAFDAPSREVCVVRRARSNTPLQALVTWNDPVYVEAAQALARAVVARATSTQGRAREALWRATGRPPDAQDVARIVRLVEQARAHLESRPRTARNLATDPLGPLPRGTEAVELAAWTVAANVLLNLDDVLVKR